MSSEKFDFNNAEEEAIEIKKRAKEKALEGMGFEKEEIEEISKDGNDDSYVASEDYQKVSKEIDKENKEKNKKKTEKTLSQILKETEENREELIKKEEEAREKSEIEKRKRKLPEVGKIFKRREVDIGEKGRFVFKRGHGAIGIVVNEDIFSNVRKVVEEIEEAVKDLEKIGEKYSTRARIEADLEVVRHANNGKSFLCKVNEVYNIEELENELEYLKRKVIEERERKKERERKEQEIKEKREKDKEVVIKNITEIALGLDLRVPKNLIEEGYFPQEYSYLKKEERITKKWKKEEVPGLIHSANMYNEGHPPIPDFTIDAIPEEGVCVSEIIKAIKERIPTETSEGLEYLEHYIENIIKHIIQENFIQIKWKVCPEELKEAMKNDNDEIIEEEESPAVTYILEDGTIPSWIK